MKQRHTTPRRKSSSRSRSPSRESKRAEQPSKESLLPNPLALQPFDPEPTAVYSLDTAAQIADVPRRTILIYCKHKFISPVAEPGIWGYWFDADAIRTLRAIRELRGKCNDEMQSLGVILHLVDEIKTLRAEIRARQNHF